MSNLIAVTDVTFTTSLPRHRARGREGWVSFVISGALRIDGVELRRATDNRLVLAFPKQTDRAGESHPIVAPIDARARKEVEAAILSALSHLFPREDDR